MIERTLILIKPDGVKRGIIGELISRFEKAGLKLAGVKMFHVDKAFAKKHYKAHLDKEFYNGLEEMITSGPVLSVVLEGLHAVEIVRKLVGPTEPRTAPPGTIRGDYASHSYAYTDPKGIAIKNLIHASGSKKEAEQEIKLWFSENEIFDYKVVHEEHTR
ncbi:MAG: nucleoside-diphosphate kinase [Candidatus Woesearchaeota archaeon]|jgi:nucleoside-diphosphate kinase|nr:nucleoside-diphosphate kinase [Candidatus Woesearchaeota archaeon]MDP7324108.1 nucleoside-diphosphate kinase [Candidatus Woesearchaeota archaeon]MDP7458017.1 nucleoside-diphosphate kinase [Candidatus Woesearchaeota archaeon]